MTDQSTTGANTAPADDYETLVAARRDFYAAAPDGLETIKNPVLVHGVVPGTGTVRAHFARWLPGYVYPAIAVEGIAVVQASNSSVLTLISILGSILVAVPVQRRLAGAPDRVYVPDRVTRIDADFRDAQDSLRRLRAEHDVRVAVTAQQPRLSWLLARLAASCASGADPDPQDLAEAEGIAARAWALAQLETRRRDLTESVSAVPRPTTIPASAPEPEADLSALDRAATESIALTENLAAVFDVPVPAIATGCTPPARDDFESIWADVEDDERPCRPCDDDHEW